MTSLAIKSSASYPTPATGIPEKITPTAASAAGQSAPPAVIPAAVITPAVDNELQQQGAPDSLAALSVLLGRALIAKSGDHLLQYSSQQMQALTLEFLLFRHWDYSQYKKLTRDRPAMTAEQWRAARPRHTALGNEILNSVKKDHPQFNDPEGSFRQLQTLAKKYALVQRSFSPFKQNIQALPKREPSFIQELLNGAINFQNNSLVGRLFRDFTLIGRLFQHDIMRSRTDPAKFREEFIQQRAQKLYPGVIRNYDARFEQLITPLPASESALLRAGQLQIFTPHLRYAASNLPTDQSPEQAGYADIGNTLDDRHLVVKAAWQGQTRWFVLPLAPQNATTPKLHVFPSENETQAFFSQLFKQKTGLSPRIRLIAAGEAFCTRDNIGQIALLTAQREVDRLTDPLLQAAMQPTTTEQIAEKVLNFATGFIPFLQGIAELREGNYQQGSLSLLLDSLPMMRQAIISAKGVVTLRKMAANAVNRAASKPLAPGRILAVTAKQSGIRQAKNNIEQPQTASTPTADAVPAAEKLARTHMQSVEIINRDGTRATEYVPLTQEQTKASYHYDSETGSFRPTGKFIGPDNKVIGLAGGTDSQEPASATPPTAGAMQPPSAALSHYDLDFAQLQIDYRQQLALTQTSGSQQGWLDFLQQQINQRWGDLCTQAQKFIRDADKTGWHQASFPRTGSVDAGLERILQTHNGIAFGEAHSVDSHAYDAAIEGSAKFLTQHLPTFSRCGVKTLYLENIPKSQALLAAIKHKNIPEIKQLFSQGQNQYIADLIIAALGKDIEVVPVDTAISLNIKVQTGEWQIRESISQNDLAARRQRLETYNYLATREIKSRSGKWISLSGHKHIATREGVAGIAELNNGFPVSLVNKMSIPQVKPVANSAGQVEISTVNRGKLS